MKLNPQFIINIEATYGDAGKKWLYLLDDHLKQLSHQWSFQLIKPMDALSYAFVAIVKYHSTYAILKTAPPAARLMAEAEWLKRHNKCVPIVFEIDKINNAYLMEKIEPGTTLKLLVESGNDEKATQILAQTILALQSENASHPINYHSISEHVNYPPISEHVNNQSISEHGNYPPILEHVNYPRISEHASYFSFLRGHLENKIIDHAEATFDDLCKDHSTDIVLHGDLHHDNILQSGTGWKVIDPHGYTGNACAEIGPLFFNPIDCFPTHSTLKKIIEARLSILAEILPFDKELMKAWAFCLTLRSAAWDIEGFGKANSQTLEIGRVLFGDDV